MNSVSIHADGGRFALAGHQDYVLNDEPMNWLKAQGVEPAIMTTLNTNAPAVFTDQVAFLEHLASKGIDILDRQLLRLSAKRQSGPPSATMVCSAGR